MTAPEYAAGTPCWIELFTTEPDTAADFYRDLLGWDAHTMTDEPGFRYTTYSEGGEQRAGIMDATAFLSDDVPSHWTVSFTVADAEPARPGQWSSAARSWRRRRTPRTAGSPRSVTRRARSSGSSSDSADPAFSPPGVGRRGR
jgi:catechol 2,3-dioxygenase-like lactoylglutathione lyase family enzyme